MRLMPNKPSAFFQIRNEILTFTNRKNLYFILKSRLYGSKSVQTFSFARCAARDDGRRNDYGEQSGQLVGAYVRSAAPCRMRRLYADRSGFSIFPVLRRRGDMVRIPQDRPSPDAVRNRQNPETWSADLYRRPAHIILSIL